MESHRIQLRGPWQFEWLDCAGSSEPFGTAGRIKLPDDWTDFLEGASGQLRLRRRFGRPAHLDPQERVLVFVEEFWGAGELRINRQSLTHIEGTANSRAECIREDITSILQPSNHLEIICTFPKLAVAGDGLWSSIGIEMFAG